MKRIVTSVVVIAALALSTVALARKGEMNPRELIETKTTRVFTFSALLFDEKSKKAIVLYEGCANNGTTCDSPIVYTGVIVQVTVTDSSCKIKKGGMAETVCNDATYRLSDLETAINAALKGLKAGCDEAFTAGYGN